MIVSSRSESIVRGALTAAGLVSAFVSCAAVLAAPPPKPAGNLQVGPTAVRLTDVQRPHSILVTAATADGQTIDLTRDAKFVSSDEKVARVDAAGWVVPVASGSATIRIAAAGRDASVPVEVALADTVRRYRFGDDVMPVLTKAGCNMGACHGYSLGKNGFKLSLRGADPQADFLALTDEFFERRINRHHPEASLLLTKPLGDVPHKGGVRLEPDSLMHDLVLGWIRAGGPADPPTLPKFESLTIHPRQVSMQPGWRQQLQVIARYDDGSTRDVTRLSAFTVNTESVASVGVDGLVSATQLGETAVSARFERTFATAEFIVLEPKADFRPTPVPTGNPVDRFVVEKLNEMHIQPSERSDDATFLRRVHIDLIGCQPTPSELASFVADASPDKRVEVVDALLARPEFVDQWSLKWGDLLQNTRTKLGEPAVYAFREWIRSAVASNMPLDEFVRGILLSQGGPQDSPTASYYAVSQDAHETLQRATQVFCGVRMLCAKCHAHPSENWTQADYYGLYNFFNQVSTKPDPRRPPGVANAKTVFLNRDAGIEANPRTGRPQPPRFLGGEEPSLVAGSDRREAYVRWLTAPDNPFFARSMANRIWSYFFHRGIIEPVDDLRSTNPPINPALLDALTREFVAGRFDMKKLMRTIVLSDTYQRSSVPNGSNTHDDVNFSRHVPRRLPAEALLDSVVQATGVAETFRNAPAGFTARQLPDGNIQNEFLALFGKPQRMEACECERDGGSNMLQALHFINGQSILGRLTNPAGRITKLVQEEKDDGTLVEQLYLWTVCRRPTADELRQSGEFFAAYGDKRLEAAQDFTWGLLNSRDFVLVH